MFDSKSFGKTIRNLRQNKNQSIESLSRELNLSEAYLGKLERGERIPSIDVAIAIANYWGISICNYLPLKTEDNNSVKQELYKNLEIIKSKDAYNFLYDTLLELIALLNRGDENV